MKNLYIKLNFLIFLILTLFSCQNLSDSVSNKEDQVTCTLTFTGAFPREILNSINKKNNRSAYPDLTGYFDDCEYIITLLDKNNNPLEGAEADDIDEETLSFTVNGIKKNVPFKIHVDLKKKDTSSSIYKNLVVMSGTSEEYTLSDSNPVLSIKLPIAPAQTDEGTGNISIYIWRNGNLHNVNNLYWYYSIDNSPFVLGTEQGEELQMDLGIAAGVHQLAIQLRYRNSDNTERLLYSLKETVYVFDNMATDLWTGNSPYIVNASDYDPTLNGTHNAVITDAMIISQQQKYFYVDSSRSKIAGTANYTSETGTYVNPYTKVSDAIKKASQADADDLTIYVKSSNTTEEWTSGNDITKNLTIEVYDATPGDKLGNYTIKNTGDVSAFDVNENKSLVASGFTFEGKGRTSDQYHAGLICYLAADNAKLKLTNCKIQNLTARSSGGAIFAASSNSNISIELINCTFNNCTSTGNGGAIAMYFGKCIIDNCSFIDCLSGGGNKGGAIYHNGTELVLKNAVSIESSTNTYSESANNIYLYNNKTITIDDSLSKAAGKDFVAYVTPYGTLNDGDFVKVLTEKRAGVIQAKYDLFRTTNSTSFFVTSDGDIINSAILALDNPPEKNSINICIPAELNKIASWVNSGASDFSGKTITLNKDITLDNTWTPIGYYTSKTNNKPFKGNFNGQGHTITYDVESASQFFSFIGCLESGSVSNLNAEGTIRSTNAYKYSSIVSYIKATGGRISNCTSSVNMELEGDGMSGGIVGWADAETLGNIVIENCFNTGNITCAGGRGIGGIAGSGSKAKFINCINNGNITAGCVVGGIVGHGENANVTNCGNTGNLTVNWDGQSSQSSGAGGIVAGPNATNSGWEPTITNCWSTGTIKSINKYTDCAGGIFGNYAGRTAIACTPSNCYYLSGSCAQAVGNVSGTVSGISTFTGTPNNYSVGSTDLITKLNQNVSGEMKRWKYGADGYPVFE